MEIKAYERALVFAARNGNEASFEELYKLYYQKITFFILMEEFNIPVEYFRPLPEHQRSEIQREFTKKLIDQYEKQDF